MFSSKVVTIFFSLDSERVLSNYMNLALYIPYRYYMNIALSERAKFSRCKGIKILIVKTKRKKENASSYRRLVTSRGPKWVDVKAKV